MTEERELHFEATTSTGTVSACIVRPDAAEWLLVLAHGGGAGMRHPFLEGVAAHLAGHGIATFRYQFPYMEKSARRPNPSAVLEATVRSAIETARREVPGLSLLAGGKSLGGRMTSRLLAQNSIAEVRGVVFFGFPLHALGTRSVERAEHLARVAAPMLFLQGTRDDLADLALLAPVCERLGRRATLHAVDGADHSFAVLKRSGRTSGDVIEELAWTVSKWTRSLKPTVEQGHIRS
jgi:hypothetical protein